MEKLDGLEEKVKKNEEPNDPILTGGFFNFAEVWKEILKLQTEIANFSVEISTLRKENGELADDYMQRLAAISDRNKKLIEETFGEGSRNDKFFQDNVNYVNKEMEKAEQHFGKLTADKDKITDLENLQSLSTLTRTAKEFAEKIKEIVIKIATDLQPAIQKGRDSELEKVENFHVDIDRIENHLNVKVGKFEQKIEAFNESIQSWMKKSCEGEKIEGASVPICSYFIRPV